MDIAKILANQVVIMFLLMAAGYFFVKIKLFSNETIGELNNFILTFVTFCVILDSYQMEYNPQDAMDLLISVILGVFSHFFGIYFSKFIFKTKTLEARLCNFGSVYCNSGFMALPLLSAVFGPKGIFYGTAYCMTFNFCLWTHGVSLLSNEKLKLNKQTIIKILKLPITITIILSLVLYLLNIRLPYQLGEAVAYIGSLNTPLAMIVIGTFVSKCRILDAFKNKKVYAICAMRLLAIPLIMIFFFKIILSFVEISQTLILSNLIITACPTAGVMAMFSEKHGIDTSLGVQTITFSTILSLATIPVLTMFAQIFLF